MNVGLLFCGAFLVKNDTLVGLQHSVLFDNAAIVLLRNSITMFEELPQLLHVTYLPTHCRCLFLYFFFPLLSAFYGLMFLAGSLWRFPSNINFLRLLQGYPSSGNLHYKSVFSWYPVGSMLLFRVKKEHSYEIARVIEIVMAEVRNQPRSKESW